MNRIYKLIWDRARNMYVVVSEITKNHGKAKSNIVKTGIVTLLVLSALGGNVYAQESLHKNSTEVTNENKNEDDLELNKSEPEDLPSLSASVRMQTEKAL